MRDIVFRGPLSLVLSFADCLKLQGLNQSPSQGETKRKTNSCSRQNKPQEMRFGYFVTSYLIILLFFSTSLSNCYEIPKNITSSQEGTWRRLDIPNPLYIPGRDPIASTQKKLILPQNSQGILNFGIRSPSEVFLNQYFFIEGTFLLYDGKFSNSGEGMNNFEMNGVYDFLNGLIYFYLTKKNTFLRPLLFPELKFNVSTRAAEAYNLALTKKFQQIKNKIPIFDQGVAIQNLQNCMFKGFAKAEKFIESNAKFEDLIQKEDIFSENLKKRYFFIKSGELLGINCNLTLAFESSTYNSDKFHSKFSTFCGILSIFAFLQILVVIYQGRASFSQSMSQKISLICIQQQTILDSILSMTVVGLAFILSRELFERSFAFACFLYFALFSIFDLILSMNVSKSHQTILENNQISQQNSNNNNQNSSEYATINNNWMLSLEKTYSKFYGVLFFSLLILYQFNLFMVPALFLLFGFWVPQIAYNIVNNTEKPFTLIFIIISSISRFPLFLYFFYYDDNILKLEPNYNLSLGLVGFMALQVSILLIQRQFGARSVLPSSVLNKYFPKKYDYHRDLPSSVFDEERGLFCVICMSDIDPNDKEQYMITPCNHVFHTPCLLRWMEEKNECAHCRRFLPNSSA